MASIPSSDGPLPVRRVAPIRPFTWLALGWRDFLSSPLAGLVHGAFVAIGGWIVVLVSLRFGWVAPGAFSGFVIVGPILVTGLYEISRLLARGEKAGLGDAIAAWRRGTLPLVQLGVLLAVLGTLWVAASALLFSLFAPAPLRGPVEFLRYAFIEQGDLLFTLWAILGGLGVAIVFSLTAVSPPLLLGRQVGFRQALLTSARAVGENPGPMLLWALLILVGTSLSLATAMIGFLVTVPVLGHASWHAYRDLVEVEGVALRNP
ncbi:MAG TPA: DUF2189 domain-containing protein [Burkholderiaceae bacterium]|nr:DUF2189 domain-containing protein [Burkholderiaceae bacterium]HQR71746.1 DUF2189 domain-containing protein [Burkholderiaceae bacterium]